MLITAIHFECTFSQSTSIGGQFEGELHHDRNNTGVIFSHVIDYMKKRAIRQEIINITLLLRLGKLLYLLWHV